MPYTIIGQPTPRIEGQDKVTGAMQYTADVALPGTLWGRALRSPLPHARIIRIDTSRAQQVPGIHAVLTGADVRGIRYGRRLGCRTSLSCISKWFGGFCSRLLRLRTGKRSSAFRLHGFTHIF